MKRLHFRVLLFLLELEDILLENHAESFFPDFDCCNYFFAHFAAWGIFSRYLDAGYSIVSQLSATYCVFVFVSGDLLSYYLFLCIFSLCIYQKSQIVAYSIVASRACFNY